MPGRNSTGTGVESPGFFPADSKWVLFFSSLFNLPIASVTTAAWREEEGKREISEESTAVLNTGSAIRPTGCRPATALSQQSPTFLIHPMGLIMLSLQLLKGEER